MWEAMRGDMRGFFEARCRYRDGLYRVFCILDDNPLVSKLPETRHGKNVLVIITAGCKKNRTGFESFYENASLLRTEYLRRTPRSWTVATIDARPET